MKKFFYVTTLCVLSVCFSGCGYDDDEVWSAINSQEERITALEEWQKMANENIAALQAVVNENDYITAVDELKNGDEIIGYTIHFYRQGEITLYNGTKGDKGENGISPIIGVTEMEDGRWYWTLNEELLTDADGNPICANGKDGQDGEDGENGNPAPVPQLKTGSELGESYISDAIYLSVDGGKEWVKISSDNDTSSTGGFITHIEDENSYYAFICTDGTTINVPKYIEGLSFTYKNNKGETTNIENGEQLVQPNEEFIINVASMGGRWNYEKSSESTKDEWTIETTEDGNGLKVTAPSTESSIFIDFTFVSTDNKKTEYQIKLTAIHTQIIENEALISALEELGIGEKDAEGKLIVTSEAIQKTTSLDLSNKNLTSLEELGIFTNLTKLECKGNNINTLDITEFPDLAYLDCSENNLTILDLSQTPDLTYLNCSDNELTSLDVSLLSELTELYCDNCFGNEVATRASFENGILNLSANMKLWRLSCENNALTGLILPETQTLESINCSNNNLTSIDISKNLSLTGLSISNNQLSQLNIASNVKLSVLECDNNDLMELNLISNTELETLDCSDNGLTQINLTSTTQLNQLRCYNNLLAELDVTMCKDLETLICYKNHLTTLNAWHNEKLTFLQCGNQQNAASDIQELTLTLNEILTEQWNANWQNDIENNHVIIADSTTIFPEGTGSDFENGGIY